MTYWHYSLHMVKIKQDWPLQQFECTTTDAFAALDDPMRGIAVVRTPEEIDPQGLVSRLSELLSNRDLPQTSPNFFYTGATDLMSDPEQPPDTKALEFDREYRSVELGVEKVIHEVLRTYQEKNLLRIFALLGHYGKSWLHKHPDSYPLTTWLGVSQPGLKLDMISGENVQLDNIPPHSLLITRQSGWQFSDGESGADLGIRHSVDWKSSSTTDVRVVGLDHRAKKNKISGTFYTRSSSQLLR